MKFSEIVDQAKALLQAKGRVSARMLRREFALDEETLQDLKFELIQTDRLAREEEGEILVWVGNGETIPVQTQASLSPSQSPATYTPLHLAERIRAEQAALEARGATDGERKTITALFADLKGSTALIEGLDPEEARAIIDPALQLMMEAVHRYDGFVAQALGDGIFALFGAPIAHEDHPQRALYAALRMQGEMRRYADTLRGKGHPPLSMRVGINTGEVIEALYQAGLDDHYSELAHHYTRSGNTEKAIEYLHLAGQQAVQRSAYVEAINHLTTALELLKTLPDTPARTQQELALQIALGAPLRATKGYTAPEVGHIYTRAWDLCQQVGETPQLFPVLWGLSYFYFVRAELQTARELGQQCLTLAQRLQDSTLLVEAHFALGITLRGLGELTPAREHLEQGIALYGPQPHRSLAVLYSQDPKVASLSNTALVLWELGYSDQALKSVHNALALARELSHPFSLAYALICAAFLHQFRLEGQLAQEWAEATVALCTGHGFSFWLMYGTMVRGWALVEQGQGEEGIAQMRQGFAAVQATGVELGRPTDLALLAEAYGKVGRVEEGLTLLAEAGVVVDKTGERFHEAEVYRLKGELTLQQFKVQGSKFKVENPQSTIRNPQSDAEACFLKAIEIARQQQAKSLELRAVMSLARLWQQGKQKESHHLLSETYGWFTEGLDTKDLQEAKALLDELARGV